MQHAQRHSRYYVQVPTTNKVEDWTIDQFWTELGKPPGPEARANPGDRSGAGDEHRPAARSFVGRFPCAWPDVPLAGDAAHIVPPPGAKGPEPGRQRRGLSVDRTVRVLQREIVRGHRHLIRPLPAPRGVPSVFRGGSPADAPAFRTGEFGQKIQEAELDYLVQPACSPVSLAENYGACR